MPSFVYTNPESEESLVCHVMSPDLTGNNFVVRLVGGEHSVNTIHEISVIPTWTDMAGYPNIAPQTAVREFVKEGIALAMTERFANEGKAITVTRQDLAAEIWEPLG